MESLSILHVDMDAFYASIEIRDDPSLTGLPLCVGGRADRRGVISAASYEARKYGVRSAMPTSRALELCPSLVLVPPDFDRYTAASRQIMEIFQRYTRSTRPSSTSLAATACTATRWPSASRSSATSCARRAWWPRSAWRRRSSWPSWRATWTSPTASA
jgi:DNA polymerase-4